MKIVFGATVCKAIAAMAIGIICSSPADGHARRARPAPETRAAPQASAFPEDQACLTAFRAAEASEQAGRLRVAKERLFLCAQPLCARAIRRQCALRFAQLDADIPSVVPVVQDEAGTPRADVQVAVDGEPLTSHLDGRALPVDPGLHRFTFSKDGEVIARQNLMIVQGQRNRLVAVSWSAPDRAATGRAVVLASTGVSSAKVERAAPGATEPGTRPDPNVIPPRTAETGRTAAPPSTLTSVTDGGGLAPRPLSRRARHALAAGHSGVGSPEAGPGPSALQLAASAADSEGSRASRGPSTTTLALALGGVGVVSAVAGGMLTFWGRADNSRLTECSPTCSESSVSHVHNLYLGADVAFGVSVAAFAGVAWAYIGGRAPADAGRRDTAYRFDVQPGARGAVARLQGTF